MNSFSKRLVGVMAIVVLASCGGEELIPPSGVASTSPSQNQEELDVGVVEQPTDEQEVAEQDSVAVAAPEPVEPVSEPDIDPNVPEITRLSLAVQSTEDGLDNIRFSDLVELFEIPNEGLLALGEYINTRINIIAVSSSESNTGSVDFELVGPTSLARTENFPPYTLAREPDHWDVSNEDLLPGEYTLSATPYSGRDATGSRGVTRNITFTVEPAAEGAVDNPDPISDDTPVDNEPEDEVFELVAVADSFTIFAGQVLNQASVSSNDTVQGSGAEYTVLEFPSNGVVDLDIDGSFVYTPNEDFFGADSFTYEVRQNGSVSSAVSNINVLTPATASGADGWTDFVSSFIVESDGSYSLGNPNNDTNPTRDSGSKIVFVDAQVGNNDSADYYWYQDGRIVDSSGSPSDAQGRAYGTDPMNPNLQAIRPFEDIDLPNDDRIRTSTHDRIGRLAGMYPDWFLFRRGQVHTEFALDFTGGRSESEPMVVASYGPLSERRAIIDPSERNPFRQHSFGRDRVWFHVAVTGLELRTDWNHLNFHRSGVRSFSGGPPTLFAEDVHVNGGSVAYPPLKTTYRRVAVTYAFNDGTGHVQGMFSSGFDLDLTMEQMFFYKNGYQSNPRRDADPIYDLFSRNIYQSGGAQMGVRYRNVISMDGGSGGPQMRLGGLMEDSLIIEGYFYSSTNSNSLNNPWMEANNQTGTSAEVRNNVQLIFGYPTQADPNTGRGTDNAAQPSWGYSLQGHSFGATVENNIISGAMLEDDLADGRGAAPFGLRLTLGPGTYGNGVTYSQKNNVIRNNIVYRTSSGIEIRGNSSGIENIDIEGNTIVSSGNPIADRLNNETDSDELDISGNRFYSDLPAPNVPWIGSNVAASYSEGVGVGRLFPDPDRTLKRYLLEVIGVSLLDWNDDPFLDPAQRIARNASGEEYDPAGMKTFAAMASFMRRGGSVAIPTGGAKPVIQADYAWDDRLTANAINNWIRAGFGVAPIE